MQEIRTGTIAICNLAGYDEDFFIPNNQTTVIATVESVITDRNGDAKSFLSKVGCSNELLGEMIKVEKDAIHYLAQTSKAKPDITDNLPEIFLNLGRIITLLERDNRLLREQNQDLREANGELKGKIQFFHEENRQTVGGLMNLPPSPLPFDYFPS